jgi:hypothetical protein
VVWEDWPQVAAGQIIFCNRGKQEQRHEENSCGGMWACASYLWTASVFSSQEKQGHQLRLREEVLEAEDRKRVWRNLIFLSVSCIGLGTREM